MTTPSCVVLSFPDAKRTPPLRPGAPRFGAGTGLALCLTIIGVPLGVANFKLALLALAPFGKTVVPLDRIPAGRDVWMQGAAADPLTPLASGGILRHAVPAGPGPGAVTTTASEAVRNAHEWFEHHSGWAPPDDETLEEWVADGVCRCPDECLVAPDAWCEHGLASWALILAALDEPPS